MGWSPKVLGNGRILVVVDPPSRVTDMRGRVLDSVAENEFARAAMKFGFKRDDFTFVSCAAPLPSPTMTEKQKVEHLKQTEELVWSVIDNRATSCTVPMGSLACRFVFGKAVQITKIRGRLHDVKGRRVFPMLSPHAVLRNPEHRQVFESDFQTLARLVENEFKVEESTDTKLDYSWQFDLIDWLGTFQPKAVAVDTETTGVRWNDPDTRVLTIQLCIGPGRAAAFPVDPDYCRRWFPEMTDQQRVILVAQLKELLEDPKVLKIGFNFKFDHQILMKPPLSIRTDPWVHDVQMLAWAANQDMLRKDLAECTRIWVPEMAGYSDLFDATVDKSRMIDVPPVDQIDLEGRRIPGMLHYACGDVDATYRLAIRLRKLVMEDERNYRRYRLIHVPALLAFAEGPERFGLRVDPEALQKLGERLEEEQRRLYDELLSETPKKVLRKHAEIKDGLKFSRDAFVRDILFSEDGFGLKPVMFTSTTADLPESQRVPQVGKDHLTFFLLDKRAGSYCRKLKEYSEVEKMLTTYVGSREEGTGFWRYINHDGRIRPVYFLHRTNTGRTASSDPNGQNYPKRGRFAKDFNKIFVPTPGYRFVDCDLSQIELRLVAWASGDPTMLQVYRSGGDIHAMTAANTMHWSYEEMMRVAQTIGEEPLADHVAKIPGADRHLANPGNKNCKVKDYIKLQRFRAKAVNFGFIYGMSAKKFRVYAKTDYELDYSESEAEQVRSIFFSTYRALPNWHNRVREEVRKTGKIRALHGGLRILPSIWSNDPAVVAMAERQAINAPIQGFASDLTLMSMIRLHRFADPEVIRPLAMIHDNLLCEAREDVIEQAAGWLRWIQENPPLRRWFGIEPPLPLVAEPSIGRNLGEMVERPDIPATKPDWWGEE